MASTGEEHEPAADGAWGDAVAHASLALARAFAAGATMWCIAPEWPEHARHVALEFVHPVIVGKRALPAVAVEGGDPAAALRSVVRPGDVLLGVGRAAAPGLLPTLRRAAPWGVTALWIGAGPRPPLDAAEHVLWGDGDGSTARCDGSLVLQYHVLWELTHVCFEHPGLLDPPPAAADGEVCVTCSDEGRVAEVVRARGAAEADVRAAGRREIVDVTLVGPVDPGDLVLVHAGTAIARLEDDAS